MKRRLLLIIGLLFGFAFAARATHQRAAEITYTWLGGNAYEFTLTCYTYTPSPAGLQRDSLLVQWGDGSEEYIPRVVLQNLGDDYTLNVYKRIHNYSSSGTYVISMEDANRNYGVVNVPNSLTVPMYIETELVINPTTTRCSCSTRPSTRAAWENYTCTILRLTTPTATA